VASDASTFGRVLVDHINVEKAAIRRSDRHGHKAAMAAAVAGVGGAAAVVVLAVVVVVSPTRILCKQRQT